MGHSTCSWGSFLSHREAAQCQSECWGECTALPPALISAPQFPHPQPWGTDQVTAVPRKQLRKSLWNLLPVLDTWISSFNLIQLHGSNAAPLCSPAARAGAAVPGRQGSHQSHQVQGGLRATPHQPEAPAWQEGKQREHSLPVLCPVTPRWGYHRAHHNLLSWTGPELGIANLPVVQVDLPLWEEGDSPHQPLPPLTSGHGSHAAGHRGRTPVLSKGQFLSSRASILWVICWIIDEATEANKGSL